MTNKLPTDAEIEADPIQALHELLAIVKNNGGSKSFAQPSDSFSVYDPSVPMVQPDTSTPLKKAIIDVENDIRNDHLENGVVFDENGKILLEKRGQPDRLEFTDSEVLLLKNRTFTHNHPNGGTFSNKDVLMAATYDILELRVVTPQFRFSMRPSHGRQWCSRMAVQPHYEQAMQQANFIVNDLVKTGSLHPRHAKSEYQHYTWAMFAMYLELVYVREKS